MIYEKIYLKDVFEAINTNATLTSYVRSNSLAIEPDRKRPCVLICPGGGYYITCEREAEPIALAFVAKGYNAFVLNYSTREESKEVFPTQLLEVSAAMAYIRRNSEYYNVLKDSVIVCGFSAGGHLAACLGTMWNEEFISETLGLSDKENRPDGMILCYPVITSGEYANKGSFKFLLDDENPPEEILEKLSLEKRVGKHTPPTFIWHTLTDDMVPVENSFLFADALRQAQVSFELHIYPEGVHGLALGSRETRDEEDFRENPYIESWFDLCAAWIERFINTENKGEKLR